MAGQEQGPAEKVLETALKSVNDAECQILLLGKGEPEITGVTVVTLCQQFGRCKRTTRVIR